MGKLNYWLFIYLESIIKTRLVYKDSTVNSIIRKHLELIKKMDQLN